MHVIMMVLIKLRVSKLRADFENKWTHLILLGNVYKSVFFFLLFIKAWGLKTEKLPVNATEF